MGGTERLFTEQASGITTPSKTHLISSSMPHITTSVIQRVGRMVEKGPRDASSLQLVGQGIRLDVSRVQTDAE